MNEITVIKASGEKVPFEPGKLRNSLKRAGADDLTADEITDRILGEMYDKMPTKEIYKKAFRYLKKYQQGIAARYSLKKAIIELGPAGYPFEKFIAKLLRHRDFSVETNLVMNGYCISHEIDVYARSEKEVLYIECKYHTDQGRKSDVKTSLYFHSRFEDLARGRTEMEGKKTVGCLVTNTRFTGEALKYGDCSDLLMISWNHPKDRSLKHLVEESGLHPVTCLTTITRAEKRSLINEDVLLCQELFSNLKVLERIVDSKKRIENIINEAEELCHL
jgi:hypothetical protein